MSQTTQATLVFVKKISYVNRSVIFFDYFTLLNIVESFFFSLLQPFRDL